MAALKVQFKKDKFNLLIPRILDYVASFDDKNEYELEIRKKKEIRSLNANNYSWTLTDKLSEKLVVAGVKLSKEECHAEMIFRYGQVLCDENGERVVYSTKQGIKMNEFFPYAKPIGNSELNGETFTHYLIYRGSKTYDTKEFSIFLSGIIEECREQGIETMTPSEIALMMENYKGGK
jgi:hypothetical protein